MSEKIQDDILDTYKNVPDFTKRFKIFDHVVVIGQKAFGSIKPIDLSKNNFCYSKNTRINSDRTKEAIYNKCKSNVRSWYDNDKFEHILNKKYYSPKSTITANEEDVDDSVVSNVNNQSPDVITVKNGVNLKGFEIADIYPACKVSMMIMTMLVMHQSEGHSKDETLKLIAAYLVFVHLLNSFCGVRMNKAWNTHIGNEYVYKK